MKYQRASYWQAAIVLIGSTALGVLAFRSEPLPREEPVRLAENCERRAPQVAQLLGLHSTSEDGTTEKLTEYKMLMSGCTPTWLCWHEPNQEMSEGVEQLCGTAQDLSRALRDGVAIDTVWVLS